MRTFPEFSTAGPEKERTKPFRRCSEESSLQKVSVLKDVHRVKLQALEPWLAAGQRTSDQSREPELHALVEHIEHVEAVLSHVGSLANVAVVEVSQYSLPLNINMCVSELKIVLLLQA